MSCYHGLGDKVRGKQAAKTALEQVEQVLAQDPSNGAAISFGVSALAALGNSTGRGNGWTERSSSIPTISTCATTSPARWRGTSATTRTPSECSKSSLSRIKGSLGNADTDPDLECIRDDPRFQKILADAKKRLGIQTRAGEMAARSSAAARLS